MTRIALVFVAFLAACSGEGQQICEPSIGITAGCEKPSDDTDVMETDQVETNDSDVRDSDTPEDTDPPPDTDTPDTDVADTDTVDTDPSVDTDETDLPPDTDVIDTDTQDTDTGTPGDPIAAERVCWNDFAFQIHERYIDWSVATTVPGDWTVVNWADTDIVQVLDASTSTQVETVYMPGRCGIGPIEANMYLPVGYVFPQLGVEYNNGIVVVFQPDGSVLEVNYFQPCFGGGYEGWVMPDANPFGACDSGIDGVRWMGGHGGSHMTATQALRPGELTGSQSIGRPLPIEVDNNHLSATNGGYRWPAASADAYYLTEYTGTIPNLRMGSILVLPSGYNCMLMVTVPGTRLCEVARDHGFVIVDDSYGANEVAFPISLEAKVGAEATLGFSLHDFQGTQFGADVATMMLSIRVLTNPEVAWTQ